MSNQLQFCVFEIDGRKKYVKISSFISRRKKVQAAFKLEEGEMAWPLRK